MEDSPLVSYVICTFNSEDDIRDTIESIKAQSYSSENQEIVVVDNCSDDDTREIIDSFEEVKLIVTPDSSYGACETFNIGFETSKGDLIAVMDDDIEIPEEWTEILVRKIQEDDNLGLVEPKIVEPSGVSRAEKGEIQTFQGCGVLARKKALKESEYYDKNYFIYSNEKELAAKMISNGYRLEGYPKTETKHKTDTNMSKRGLYYRTRNDMWYYWRFYGYGEGLMKSFFTARSSGIYALKKGFVKTYLESIFSAIRKFPHYYFKEKKIVKGLDL
jgi:glycosyltransferase involved in cell wall biosynthesis